jgi:hypothetical protein
MTAIASGQQRRGPVRSNQIGVQRRRFAAVGRSIISMRHLVHLVVAPALFVGSGAAAQIAAPLRDIIVPHRAVYDIDLARSDETSSVSSASGRMVFEITGSACLGYTMRQRMVVNIGNDDGNMGRLDFQISTFESGEGDLYSFDSRTRLNQEVIEAVVGEARRLTSGIEVTLTEPTEKTVQLDDDTLFPSQHLQAILDAAVSDRNFLAAQLYEGAGTGEVSDAVTAAIGGVESSGSEGALRNGVRHWPVSVGYFGGADGSEEVFGEETPSYQMQFTLYENGVTNDLLMDYGDYALSGSLEQIEPLEKPDCPSP